VKEITKPSPDYKPSLDAPLTTNQTLPDFNGNIGTTSPPSPGAVGVTDSSLGSGFPFRAFGPYTIINQLVDQVQLLRPIRRDSDGNPRVRVNRIKRNVEQARSLEVKPL
jgi:hypothetical protein